MKGMGMMGLMGIMGFMGLDDAKLFAEGIGVVAEAFHLKARPNEWPHSLGIIVANLF